MTMTDSRAAEVLAAMRDEGSCVDDADWTAAIDRAIAALSQQPEAQAQGGGAAVMYVVTPGGVSITPAEYATLADAGSDVSRWRPLIYGDTAPPSAPVGVDAMREIYGAVIRALAAIVNVNTPDKLFDLDAIPNAPVMEQVMVIRAQMDKLSALAQQPAAVDGAMVERVTKAYCGWFGSVAQGINTLALRHALETEFAPKSGGYGNE